LRAIATAMSLEPVARTRKADLVNQILRAAGVEIEDAPGAHAGASEPAHSPAVNGAAGRTGSDAAAPPRPAPSQRKVARHGLAQQPRPTRRRRRAPTEVQVNPAAVPQTARSRQILHLSTGTILLPQPKMARR